VTATSGNWSGWADAADKNVALRFVQADWNIPSISCARSTEGSEGAAYTSQWVGLDGFSSSTVEQTGTTAFCQGTDPAAYYAWYEFYPMDPVTFSGVSPGDAMDASVYFNGSTYTTTLTDLTTGSARTRTQRCPSGSTCANSSAEVIMEDPGDSAPGLGLAAFGQVNFTSARVTSRNGTKGTLASGGLWKATQINLADSSNGQVLATAGPLEGGAAFADTWVRSL
jgi:Peptidase A4 family